MKKALILIFLVSSVLFSQNKKSIDSINSIYTQGLNIPEDSILQLYKDNAENARKISYEKGIAGAYSKLSLAYSYQGIYDKSTQYGLEAVKLYEKLGLNDQVAYRYAEMGYSMKYSNMEKAQAYMQKGKSVAEAKKLDSVLKDIYNNYGVLKEIQKQLDSALYFYNKGLKIKKEQNDSIGIPYSISNLAGVYGLQKKYGKAKEYFNQSLQTRLKMEDSIGVAENYTQIGEVFMAEEKYDEAIQYIKKSLPISVEKEYRNLTQYNYKTLSDIFKNQNKADSALFYFEKYLAVKDSIHNTEIQKKIAELSIEFETEKKEKELAERELEIKQKNTLLYGSLGLAFLLGLLGYLFYNQQKLKNRQLKKESELKTALAKIETQNRLQEQRLRISRDLHDNIGAQLTFIISSIDNLKYGLKGATLKTKEKLSSISAFTSQTIYELRDTIWAMNKESITFEDLQARITNFINKASNASNNVEFTFYVSENIPANYMFTSVVGMNIYRIIQEAVNNALKYADSSSIYVEISEERDNFFIEISDDGKGFNITETEQGNGLNNMKKRAREIDGILEIVSKKNIGSSVILKISIKPTRP
ncbi:tetratricopeptide repeat-containing sensor histidine kinase [Marixanthomonas ophiurae]|uniref:histidine kinase n=1 Tax=Marixanthomonas ophiurae TaxID=387659 RepID=A0A3E1QC96_9FLAO|nr:sensor histidine kinase [Marixanthomonas ophiurae]RFN59748.1 two-component sensor histidine kinase [Marixanthomonas ophiurae]